MYENRSAMDYKIYITFFLFAISVVNSQTNKNTNTNGNVVFPSDVTDNGDGNIVFSTDIIDDNGNIVFSIDNTSNEYDPKDLLPKNCGEFTNKPQSRIIGGRESDLGEFPYVALLEYRTTAGLHSTMTSCGGAVISKRYVLTAAHCVKGTTDRLVSVRLGEYNTETKRDCVASGYDRLVCADDPISVNIEKEIVHENYILDDPDEHNDIALLRLARPIKFTKYIKPICLPSSSRLDRGFVVTGWGQIGTGNEKSEVLRKVTLPLFDWTKCNSIYAGGSYPRAIVSSQICAGGETYEDTCQGDSGNPLMQAVKDAHRVWRFEAVGIASFGTFLCGTDNAPGVYTNVYSFVPWIHSQLRP